MALRIAFPALFSYILKTGKLFAGQLGLEEEQGEEAQPQQSKLGLSVENVTKELADRFDLPSTKGVVVTEVRPGGFADDVGLSRGDVILEINKQAVNDANDFSRIQQQLKKGDDVVFLVRPARGGRNAATAFLGGTLQ